jgi:Spy/CpxP family protein refolding chaperone
MIGQKAHSMGALLLILVSGAMLVQAQPGPGGPGQRPGPPLEGGPGPMQGNRPPMDRGPAGRWWTNPAMVEKLGLSADQKSKIDAVFQQSRLKLIDLNANLQKEQATLEPLLEAEHPDESKVLAQIDRIAQARGELEKANARMLLGFRGVLTQDQWRKLQSDAPPGPPPREHRFD